MQPVSETAPTAPDAARDTIKEARERAVAGRGAGAPAVRELTPQTRRLHVRDVFTSLPMAKVFALRDFQSRYKQSLLGPIWLIIQPLTMVGAFTVIFGSVAEVDTNGIPYPLFSLVGITVWLTLQISVLFGARCMVANKSVLKSIPVPRLAFISSTLMASLPQFAFMVAGALVTVAVIGDPLRWEILALPLCIVWVWVFLYAITLPLATWHVRYRDVGSTIPFIFQAGLFLSPVAYPVSEAPATLQTLLALNPVTGIIETWRWSLLGSDVSTLALVAALAWTVGLSVLGWRVFVRAEAKFADVV